MSAIEAVLLDSGEFSFTIESRLLRELGERLVREPEIAIVELIKNSYDADATFCEIDYSAGKEISVIDDGVGMTLGQFQDGWMRIGTSSKTKSPRSKVFRRHITGEKGIGRFAVRFLGRKLHLETVALDEDRNELTKLTADFDWPSFDRHEDIGKIKVPYVLERVSGEFRLGTTLRIWNLRDQVSSLKLQRVRTESIGVLSPLRALFQADVSSSRTARPAKDPGFSLLIREGEQETEEDVANSLLEGYVLRATIVLRGSNLDLQVFRKGDPEPYLSIKDTYPNEIGPVRADVRFYPRRKGVFTDTNMDGRRAHRWITENSGVAVFDRDFRVQPYGNSDDDWLLLTRDAARSLREPSSAIAAKHFPMSSAVRSDPALNWMLRLPEARQLVGVVQVEGRREGQSSNDDRGLIAAADREGFMVNAAYAQLRDLVRGAVEAIAFCDRRWQQEQAEEERRRRLEAMRRETQDAISDIQSSPEISPREKQRIIDTLTNTQDFVEQQEEDSRERERQLEVMSLLGVIAGFMTHEFGAALQNLTEVERTLREAAERIPEIIPVAESIAQRIKNLEEFVGYSQGYIAGTRSVPNEPYFARPRLVRMRRVFGQYATERNIEVEIDVERDLYAPPVPTSLYDGIALNLYTNALKAVTARAGPGPRIIAFRAWNDQQWHYLEVSDTGVGIPEALRDRVFDALFTTTSGRRDPLGSGMGLGLSLVRKGAEAFGGRIEVAEPPIGFVTCVRVQLPLSEDGV